MQLISGKLAGLYFYHFKNSQDEKTYKIAVDPAKKKFTAKGLKVCAPYENDVPYSFKLAPQTAKTIFYGIEQASHKKYKMKFNYSTSKDKK